MNSRTSHDVRDLADKADERALRYPMAHPGYRLYIGVAKALRDIAKDMDAGYTLDASHVESLLEPFEAVLDYKDN